MKQQFLEDKEDTIRLTIYKDNRSIIPSAATITLYTANGSVLEANTAADIDVTTGELSYSLTTTHTADRDLNYKAEWSYTVDGTVFYETQLFDVVRSLLSIPITDNDLYSELSSLRKANDQQTGTATDGAAGSLTDTLNRKEEDDYWTGGVLKILSGTGAGQDRDVSDFVQATSAISVSPNFTTTPDSTSVYQVVKSFTPQIVRSFEKLEQMIYDKGRRHQLILESSQIKIPLIYLTVHFICLDLMDEDVDKWSRLAEIYGEKFKQSFSDLRLEYDADDSGTITGEEEQAGLNIVRISRS